MRDKKKGETSLPNPLPLFPFRRLQRRIQYSLSRSPSNFSMFNRCSDSHLTLGSLKRLCFLGENGILYIFITDLIKDENVLWVSIIQPN